MRGAATGRRTPWLINAARRPRLWLAYLGLGSLGIVIYLALPSEGIQSAAYCLFGVGAVASIGFGVARNRPARRGPWLLMAAGLAAITVGDLIWAGFKIATGAIPVPSIADAFYLVGYLGLGAGILSLFGARGARGDRATLIDATILATGAGTLSWVFLMYPYLHDSTLSPIESLTAVMYPLADVLLLGVTARLLLAPGHRVPAFWILVAALGAFFLADTVYTFLFLYGGYQAGELQDAAWLAGYLCWGAMALHPSMAHLGRPGVASVPRLSQRRVVLLAGASLMAPLVILVEQVRGEPIDVPVVVGVSAALFLLVTARLGMVIGELGRSQAHYRTLVEQASDAIFIADAEGHYLDVNVAACALLGYTREELLELSIPEVVPPAANPGQAGRLGQMRSGQSVISERIMRRKDGSFLPAELSARQLPDGRLHAIVRDITVRKVAEAERDRLAAVVDQADEAIVITDPSATILYVNPAFERVSGYPRAELLGGNPRILQSGQHDRGFYQAMWATLLAGQTWHGTLVNRRKDGSRYEEDAVITPIHDASGALVSYVGVKRDVTRERTLEAQLRQAQKMEAVGRLAGGIAHDFNNLLVAIRGYAELTHLATSPGDEVHEFSAQVLKASDRAKLLTQRLLTFARQQPASPEAVDLNDVVRGLAPMLGQIVDERTALTFELSPEPVVARVDVALLEQAILNLAINARDAIPGRGTIGITTGFKNAENVAWAAGAGHAPGRYAVIEVADNGQGISPEDLPHLFEPFFTTKPVNKGTGLGLSIVYAVVTGAGGSVSVDSTPGVGARFRLLFPTAEPVRDTETAPPKPAIAGLHGTESILLVEDEASVRAFVGRILTRSGYRVCEAASAEEALQIVETGVPPAILVTDVLLPKASGPELAELLRARFPGLGVLFVSGYDGDQLSSDGRFEPGTAFLSKPFASDQLLRAVRSVLDAPMLLEA